MINVKNVTYTYMAGGPFEKTAVDGVSANIEQGEFVGVIGHTGSGKSTFIQMLNGLIKPTSGAVIVDGQELHTKGTVMRDVRFKVGLVMQYPEYQLFEETVFKDIAFGPTNMGLSEEEVKKHVEFAADMVGIPKEMLEKSPFDLSGGQKRRVAIAGVLAMMPKVLILDEPTAGLDPAGRDEILYKIRDMHRRMNITVILVSHSMEDIAKIADRIIVMNMGKIAMDGKPKEVFSHPMELAKMGLSVPQITLICDKLKSQGISVSEGIYTTQTACGEIAKLLKK